MFLFLIETLATYDTMERLRIILDFEGLFVIDKVGRSGGPLGRDWRRSDVKTRAASSEVRRLRGRWADPSRDWRRGRENMVCSCLTRELGVSDGGSARQRL